MAKAAQSIQQDLKQIGITVNPKKVTYAELEDQSRQARQHRVFDDGLDTRFPRTRPTSWCRSSAPKASRRVQPQPVVLQQSAVNKLLNALKPN
jgi:ABC-type transport system substrate-binding protein